MAIGSDDITGLVTEAGSTLDSGAGGAVSLRLGDDIEGGGQPVPRLQPSQGAGEVPLPDPDAALLAA